LDMTKSAGWTARRIKGPKGAWNTREHLELLSYYVRCRILLRLCWGFRRICKFTPSTLVRLGLMDPEELFRKSEPHNKKKQDSRRWRLISNVSLVDTLTQLTIHKAQNCSVIRSFQMNPSEATCVAGLGHDDQGFKPWAEFSNAFLQRRLTGRPGQA
jgi:hypothetical protein